MARPIPKASFFYRTLIGLCIFSSLLSAQPTMDCAESTAHYALSGMAFANSGDNVLDEIRTVRIELESRLFFSDPFALEPGIDARRIVFYRLGLAFPLLEPSWTATREALRSDSGISSDFERKIIDSAASLLKDETASQDALGGAVLSLRRLQTLRQRDQPAETPVQSEEESSESSSTENESDSSESESDSSESESDSSESESDSSESESDSSESGESSSGDSDSADSAEASGESNSDSESDGQSESAPPSHPPDVKNYHASAIETEQKPSKNPQMQRIVAMVNEAGVPYFIHKRFQGIDALGNNLYVGPIFDAARVHYHRNPTHTLTMKAGEEKGQVLPLLPPLGFEPIEFSNDLGKVWKDETGNYYYQTHLEELPVPLLKEGKPNRPLSPEEVEAYTSGVGVPLSAWPDKIQNAVAQLKAAIDSQKISGPKRNVIVARALGAFIRREYKYRVHADEVGISAMELAQRGAFQCATASLITAALLRTEFDIPVEVLGVIRGSRLKRGDPNISLVYVPQIGHAVIRVYDDLGVGHIVDPTPDEKDEEIDSPKSESNFEANALPQEFTSDEDVEDSNENDSSSASDASEEVDTSEDGAQSASTESESETGEQTQQGSEATSSSSGAGSEAGSESSQPVSDEQGASSGAQEELSDIIEELVARQNARRADRNAESEPGGSSSKNGDADEDTGGDSERAKSEGEDESSEATLISDSPNETKTDDFLKELELANPLVKRFLMGLSKWAMDVELSGEEKMERIHQLKGMLGRDTTNNFPPFRQLQGALVEASSIFKNPSPPFDRWLTRIVNEAAKSPVNETVDQLSEMQLQIEYSMKFLEVSEQVGLRELLVAIRRLKIQLGKIRHEDATRIRISQELFENLAGNISRTIIRERFGLEYGVGANINTMQLADAVLKGELNDYRLQAILGPHTSFVTKPIYKPSEATVRTWEADRRSHRRPQVILTGDARLRQHFVGPLAADMSESEALARREMMALVPYETLTIPFGAENDNPERVTIVLFDTSGSMSGDPQYFVSQYIGALIDRALSDVGPDGAPRHRVVIAGFDTTVHSHTEVQTIEKAESVLKQLMQKTRNTSGGTDIQAALLWGADYLTTRLVGRGNLVLMSDGQSNVDEESIRNAFLPIREETDLLFNFCAINGSNPTLQMLAANPHLGSDTSSYVEWNATDIMELVKRSRAPAVPVSDFWTEYTWNQMPASVRQAFDLVRPAIMRYREQRIRMRGTRNLTPSTDRLNKEVKKIGLNRPRNRKNSMTGQLMSLRRVFEYFGRDFERAERRWLAEWTYVEWDNQVPRGTLLSQYEIAELYHLLNWSETGVAMRRGED